MLVPTFARTFGSLCRKADGNSSLQALMLSQTKLNSGSLEKQTEPHYIPDLVDKRIIVIDRSIDRAHKTMQF